MEHSWSSRKGPASGSSLLTPPASAASHSIVLPPPHTLPSRTRVHPSSASAFGIPSAGVSPSQTSQTSHTDSPFGPRRSYDGPASYRGREQFSASAALGPRPSFSTNDLSGRFHSDEFSRPSSASSSGFSSPRCTLGYTSGHDCSEDDVRRRETTNRPYGLRQSFSSDLLGA
jgi:hypothetical protein